MASKKPVKKAAAKKVAPRSDKSKPVVETADGAPPKKPPTKQDDLFANPDSVQPVQLQDEMERSFRTMQCRSSCRAHCPTFAMV